MPTLTSVTNHFITGKEGFTTTTSGSVASGATTVGLNSVSGYTNGDSVAFVIDPTDANKKQVFTGTIDTSGVQVTDVVWTEGTNQTHAAGATVVDYTTATHQAALVKGLLVSLDQDGTLKAGAVDNSAVIANDVIDSQHYVAGSIDTEHYAASSVTPEKRSGGFKVGTITTTNLGSTGNKAITGVGFRPKKLVIYVGYDISAAGNARESYGVTDGTTTYCRGSAVGTNTVARWFLTDIIVNIRTETNMTVLAATLVSIDADGFTINVGTSDASYSGWYEAYA